MTPIVIERKGISRLLLAGLCLLGGGCAHVCDYVDSSITCLHCEKQALHTWHYLRDAYAGVHFPHHFGAGFRAGYVDVCRGGSGCPPTLPPRCYWTFRYRNEVGRAKIVEWFNGHAAGAAVATSEGHQQFAQLPTAQQAAGRCGCEEQTEYDLSDLEQHRFEDNEFPAPPMRQLPEVSDDFHKVHTEPPPAIEPPLPSSPETTPSHDSQPAPPPSQSPDPPSTDRMTPAGPPSPPESSTADRFEAQQSEPTAAAPDESLQFGHSISPLDPAEDSNTANRTPAPSEPAMSGSDVEVPPTAAKRDRTPLPPLPTPSDTWQRQPYSPPPMLPGADSPYLMPNNVWPLPVPPAEEPDAEEIPLEDRFLPRTNQSAETTSIRVQPATRSLIEEFGRLQQASYRSGLR